MAGIKKTKKTKPTAKRNTKVEMEAYPFIAVGQVVHITSPVVATVKCVKSKLACTAEDGTECILLRDGHACDTSQHTLGWCLGECRRDNTEVVFIPATEAEVKA